MPKVRGSKFRRPVDVVVGGVDGVLHLLVDDVAVAVAAAVAVEVVEEAIGGGSREVMQRFSLRSTRQAEIEDRYRPGWHSKMEV
jgi:hypothetical protein